MSRRSSRAVSSPPAAAAASPPLQRASSRQARAKPAPSAPSASSAPSSSSGRRGALRAAAVAEAPPDEEDPPVGTMEPDSSIFPFARYSANNGKMPLPVEKKTLSLNDKDEAKFNRLPEDARAACVAAVTRLMLLRATKNEAVTRQRISDTLKKVNTSYAPYVSASLKEAQKILQDTFGLFLLDESQVPGVSDGEKKEKKEKYYIVNTLRTPNFMRMLSDSLDTSEHVFRGALVVVLHAIFAAPGRRIDLVSLVKRLREVDRRIPDEVVLGAGKKSSSKAVKDEAADDASESEDEVVGVKSQRSRADRASQRSQELVKDEDGEIGEQDGAASSIEPNKKRRRISNGNINLSNYSITASGDIDVKKAVEKMIKEGYLMKCRSEAAEGDANSAVAYTFGPRFFVEIGLTRLIYSYFDARGMEPTQSIIKDVENEEIRLRAALKVQNDDDRIDGGEYKDNI